MKSDTKFVIRAVKAWISRRVWDWKRPTYRKQLMHRYWHKIRYFRESYRIRRNWAIWGEDWRQRQNETQRMISRGQQ